MIRYYIKKERKQIMVMDLFNDCLQPIIEKEKCDYNPTISAAHSIMMECSSNVVSGKRLKEIQEKTLKTLSDFLAPTYGPMGSYTQIIGGSDQDSTFTKYSKDGLTVLSKILFNKPIEVSIKTEIEEVCRYVESRVGDGTTSAVILSQLIFSKLLQIQEKHNIPPHELRTAFDTAVDTVKERIREKGRDIKLSDIYDICMISTNGNREISKNIANIYMDYDMSVDINVEISPTSESMLKEYDGITFDEGYSDPAYVNNRTTNTADIHNANVYLFEDPADDNHMISLFEKILHHNILEQISNNRMPIPTVIMCPRLSRDSIAMLNKIIEALYAYDANGITNQKPQVLVITNYLGIGEGVAYDIGKLCGCKGIRKYINTETEKKDQESGDAPTIDTVCENFAGHAELVSADSKRTKFINPEAMVKNPEIYNSLISFLENELVVAKERAEDRTYIGSIKERLKRLKDNNVDYYVGGIAISDRDALRDLVIDAVKNCRSACKNGVGFAANFEGLRASFKLVEALKIDNGSKVYSKLYIDIATCLFQAYFGAAKLLYGSVIPDEDKVTDIIRKSLKECDSPFDLNELVTNGTQTKGHSVLCSIETDIEILEAVKKIIGLMASSNQCILQSTAVNTY